MNDYGYVPNQDGYDRWQNGTVKTVGDEIQYRQQQFPMLTAPRPYPYAPYPYHPYMHYPYHHYHHPYMHYPHHYHYPYMNYTDFTAFQYHKY